MGSSVSVRVIDARASRVSSRITVWALRLAAGAASPSKPKHSLHVRDVRSAQLLDCASCFR